MCDYWYVTILARQVTTRIDGTHENMEVTLRLTDMLVTLCTISNSANRI